MRKLTPVKGKMELEYDNEEWDVATFPAKWGLCPECEGRGTVVAPGIDDQGLTHEDLASDPDFAEDYFRGRYDVTCPECRGRTTVLVVDEDALTPEQEDLLTEVKADIEAAAELDYSLEVCRQHERRQLGGY